MIRLYSVDSTNSGQRKLVYSKKEFQIDGEDYTEKYIIEEKEVSDDYSSLVTAEFLESIPAVRNYHDFLEEIKKLLIGQIIYTVANDDSEKAIYIFRKIPNLYTNLTYFILEFKYIPESEGFYELVKKIFKFSDEKFSTDIACTISNGFSFITDLRLLELPFAKQEILELNENIFKKFKLKSKNGKIREIIAPHPVIKRVLRNLNELFQDVYDKRNNNFQIAYKKNKSVKDGALIHKDNQFVFNIDLKDFYPSCKKELVEKYVDFLFRNTFNSKFFKEELLSVILDNEGLFIGNPMSGCLANTIISKAVAYLNTICKKYNIAISVYADDISFSSSKFLSKEFVLSLFKHAMKEYKLDNYFKINKKKCIGFSKNNRKITGVSINQNNKVTVSKHFYRELRSMLEHAANGKSVNINTLRGKIAYATMIDDSGKIIRYLKKYESTVKKYNLYNKKL